MTTTTVFVCTLRGGAPKWSQYVFPFAVDAFTQLGTDLYIRSGDVVRKLTADSAQDIVDGVATDADATVQWGWLDFGAPLRDKHLEGFDLIAETEGTIEVAFGYDHRDTGAFSTAIEVDPDTAAGGLIPYDMLAPSLSVRLSFTGGTAWSVDQVGLYFVPTGGR